MGGVGGHIRCKDNTLFPPKSIRMWASFAIFVKTKLCKHEAQILMGGLFAGFNSLHA